MKQVSLFAALALAVCTAPAFAQTTKLTLGHGAAIGNPRHEAAVAFANAVKQKSGGKIEVQVAPSAQLGDDAAMITAPVRHARHVRQQPGRHRSDCP